MLRLTNQFRTDAQALKEHLQGSAKAFADLFQDLKPLAFKAYKAFPARDKDSFKGRAKMFALEAQTLPEMLDFLNKWIGSVELAKSWRNTVVSQARDALLFGKAYQDALDQVLNQAAKGFEASTLYEAQTPLRKAIPAPLLEYLPKKIVIEVDQKNQIRHVTDRFENEHRTLGHKIETMRTLVRRYNAIAKQVKKDLKSSNEILQMSALVTAMMMETGIRPGQAGNGVVKTVDGDTIEIETFGAVTLGPKHVQLVRHNFATLEFVGKKGGVNTATLSDANIIKVLDSYVKRALSQGSQYIFVTRTGQQFSYTDLQRYFKANFEGLVPTDFRKLKATDAVLTALRDEQESLYEKIRSFASSAKEDLRERVIEALVGTFEAAIAKSQKALSHDNAATTVRSYINPEIVLRFLSTGRADATLEDAILGGKTTLAFDPKVFLLAAGVTASSRISSLGDLMAQVEQDLESDLFGVSLD